MSRATMPAIDQAHEDGRPLSLRLNRLTKRFGAVHAVDSIDFQVEEGESIALLGPSGSGKSTLLGLIAGFHVPSEGTIILRNKDVSRLTPAARCIGVVFQNYALFSHMTVEENVGYGLKVRSWAKPDRRARAMEMLELVGLAGYGGRLPKELSGGQQQRVALARALAFEPDLLLLDEPLGALDREIRFQMQTEIRRIHRELKTTMIHVTHDREEAMALGDRIAIMRDGRIVASGSPADLFDRPVSSFVASFFCAFNLLPVEVVRVISPSIATVRWNEQSLDVRIGGDFVDAGRAFLAVPRSEIRLGGSSPRDFRMRGDVVDALYLGDVTELTVSVANAAQVIARVTSDKMGSQPPRGQIDLSVPREALRVVR